MPKSKRLLSDSRSNVFVYLTGHGGDEFLKFQDKEEVSSTDLANALDQMYAKRRYNEARWLTSPSRPTTVLTHRSLARRSFSS